MKSSAKTVAEYLDSLPIEKRQIIESVRKLIIRNHPHGLEEGIQWGMISYFVPLKDYPRGYGWDKKTPLPFVELAAQKNHFAIYMSFLYGNESLNKWFVKEYEKGPKKLDMGKGCLRFKKLEDLNIDLLKEVFSKITVPEFIASYDKVRSKK